MKRVLKGSYESCRGSDVCKNLSRFRVSSCPNMSPQEEPAPPVATGVYGSLTTTPFLSFFAITGANVDFNVVGPFSGTTPNIVDDSITVNSDGVYTISFATAIILFSPENEDVIVEFAITINGIFNPILLLSKQIEITSLNSEIDTLSRTALLTLNQGDVVRVLIVNSTGEEKVSYFSAELVVTKVA